MTSKIVFEQRLDISTHKLFHANQLLVCCWYIF